MKKEALIIAASVAFLILIGSGLTGFLIAGESSGYKNWTFSNSSEYIYNSSLVSFSENNVSLKGQTIVTTHTNVSVQQFNLTRGLYDPDDKLEKVESLDDTKLDFEKEKILDLVFGGNLENGENISIYIKSGSAANISLCSPGSTCTSPEYGNVSYSGSGEGYHNITIQNLPEPTRLFTIVSSREIKVDHVSGPQNLVGAFYKPTDRTDKIQAFDSDKFEIEKNKFFNIFFNQSLGNNYTLNFYLEGNNSANISVCQFYNCSKTYGLIQYTGTEGWFSLNLSGLGSPEKQFSLNSTKDVKINYLNSSFTNVSYYNVSNTSFPSSGFVQTTDLEINNIKKWGSFDFSHTLNGQNISYLYSLDSGNIWNSIPADFFDISSKKIRFGINLTSNTTQTPSVKFVFVNYTKSVPAMPVLDETKKASPGDIVNITLNLTNPSLVSNATAYVKHYNSTIILTVQLNLDNSTDLFIGKWNSSGIRAGLYYIDIQVQSPYSENLNQKQLISLIESTRGSFLNSSIKFLENQTLRIDAKNHSSTVLDITAKENLTDVSVSITEYTKNVRVSNSKSELGKYIDIEADSSANNFSSITFTIYYNESEIQQTGLNEDTLKIHYFNETSNQWTELNSALNKTGKYLTVNLTHFSTYGVFGDLVQSSSSSGGSGGGGSGSWYQSTTKPVSIVIPISTFDYPEVEKSKPEKPVEEKTEKKACIYSIDVSINPKKIKNTGTCQIEKILISVSPNLGNFIYIEKNQLEKIGVGELADFDFRGRGSVFFNSITGLSVGSGTVLHGGVIVFEARNESDIVGRFEVPINVKAPSENRELPNLFSQILILILVSAALIEHHRIAH